MKDVKTDNSIDYNNVILYGDGSASPNPGFHGSGIHGYVYKDSTLGTKKSDKPTGYLMSDKGYKVNGEVNSEILVEVVPHLYIDGYSSFIGKASNNVAEAEAFIKGIDKVIEEIEDIKSISFYTDSMYLVHIYKNVRRGEVWKDTERSNQSTWDDVSSIVNKCKEMNIKLTLGKVLGHSSDLGNHLADVLALLGRLQSTKKKIHLDIRFTTGTKYWKYDIKKHPMINYSNLFFYSNKPDVGDYSIMQYKGKDNLGKTTPISGFGHVRLKDKVPIIADLIETYNKTTKSLSVLSEVDTRQLYNKVMYRYYDFFGNDIFTTRTKPRQTVSYLEENIICKNTNPPGLANKTMKKVLNLNTYLDYYIENSKVLNENTEIGSFLKDDLVNNNIYQIFEITDKFYEVDNKGKYKCIVDTTTKVVKIDYNYMDVPTTITIYLGVDFLVRNNIKQLEEWKPRIMCFIEKDGPGMYNYYIIVDSQLKKDIGIYCNLFSNVTFVPK